MGARRTERGRLFRAEPGREVDDELDFHIEQRIAEYMAAGMDEASARRAALERLGDVDSVRGECVDQLVAERRTLARRDWLSDFGQDLRFAARAAARAPLFTVMAIVTLALGIGANSAVFGVVKSVLLNALPYGEPDRIVRVLARYETEGGASSLSAGTAVDVAERQRSFTAVAATSTGGPDAVLQADDGATTVRLAWVQPGFFDVLGVSPVMGRAFDAADVADTARVVVLTHGLWQNRYGGDREILGRTVVLNGLTRTVIGVLPRGFVDPVEYTDIYMPLNLAPVLNNPVAARGAHWLQMVARLQPGVPLEAARADVGAIGEQLARDHARENPGLTLAADPLRETMVGDTRTPLLILLGSAGLVLLIACANLAAALLSRAIARRREFAVRVSLGAGRSRLVRQLLAESLLLALAGGIAALFVANAGLGLLRGANLAAIPDYADLALDAGAVAFTFLLALVAGLAFGITPALSVGSAQPQSILRDESRGATESRGSARLRGALVAAQVALCLSILTGAGLLARSLWLMASLPLGFEAGDRMAFTTILPSARFPAHDDVQRFRDEMAERIAAMPGVQSVAVTNFVPTQVYNSNGVAIVGAENPPDAPPFVLTTGAGETYFATLGIPVVEGRTFTSGDHADAPLVAVISETMARTFWADGRAIGSFIRVGPNPESTPFEVIGIVRDVRTDLTQAQIAPMLYIPLRQGWWGSTFIVHADGNPLRLANPIRQALAVQDPTVPMTNVTTLQRVVADGLAARRIPMLLMLTFGALALLLACIGIYALFANLALAREREFGVRMALGSSPGAVAALVLRQGALWMGVGLAAGVVGMVAVSRAVRSLIYGIAPLDPAAVALAVGALLISAAVALAVPVRRATRTDPLSVMR